MPIFFQTAFLAEAAIMEAIDHDCVLRCLGSVTQSEPMMIVFENHGHGDLKSYLGNSRNDGLDNHAMVQFALSIAQGLEFLHGKSVVHKDLATRNCLVTLEDSVSRHFPLTPRLQRSPYRPPKCASEDHPPSATC